MTIISKTGYCELSLTILAGVDGHCKWVLCLMGWLLLLWETSEDFVTALFFISLHSGFDDMASIVSKAPNVILLLTDSVMTPF